MNIAILGAGSVGGTLGRRMAEAGHRIAFGVPSPKDGKYAQLTTAIGRETTVTSVAEAARGAEVVILATPWDAAREALQTAGDLSGKVVIDCTNPLKFGPEGLSLTLGFTTSGAEQVASWAKGATVAKCFNQTGFGNMASPRYGDQRSVMFVCGDDAAARKTARQLADEIGFDAVDAGPLRIARLLEPLAMLWIHLSATTTLKRDFAFALLRR
jgi:predicted dinucleotide-binding enzyme